MRRLEELNLRKQAEEASLQKAGSKIRRFLRKHCTINAEKIGFIDASFKASGSNVPESGDDDDETSDSERDSDSSKSGSGGQQATKIRTIEILT